MARFVGGSQWRLLRGWLGVLPPEQSPDCQQTTQTKLKSLVWGETAAHSASQQTFRSDKGGQGD